MLAINATLKAHHILVRGYSCDNPHLLIAHRSLPLDGDFVLPLADHVIPQNPPHQNGISRLP